MLITEDDCVELMLMLWFGKVMPKIMLEKRVKWLLKLDI